MNGLHERLDRLEGRITSWLVGHSIALLRIGLGIVFVGFGSLKLFPDVSPAEDLAVDTLDFLTFGVVPARVGVAILATLECAIGLGLITGKFLRLTLVLLGFQMIGAISPLFLFSAELFSGPFHAPTLEGQYVIKDVVLISAGLVIGATLHGGRLVAEHVRRAEDFRSYTGGRSENLHSTNLIPGKRGPNRGVPRR